MEIIIESNSGLIIILGIVPILLLRTYWNAFVYIKINPDEYFPFHPKNNLIFLHCLCVFYWKKKQSDSKKIRNYKRIANWISGISIICFGLLILTIKLFT